MPTDPSPRSPLVTVILTTFQQGPWVRSAVESVLAQTYSNWELVLVDNGSTDETASVLETFRGDPRVRLVRYESNQRHTVISNEAVRAARGEYVSFLYGDDYYLPEKLERQMEKFSTLGPEFGGVYSGGYAHEEPEGRLVPVPCGHLRGDILKDLLVEQPFLPVSPIVRRECLIRYPFDETLFIEAEAIFIKIGMSYRWDYVDGLHCAMRVHGQNMRFEIDASLERNVRLLEAAFAHADFPRDRRHLRGPTLSWIYSIKGWEAIRRELRYAVGRQWLLRAVRHDPRALLNVRVLLGLTVSALPTPAARGVIELMNVAFGRPPSQPLRSYGA